MPSPSQLEFQAQQGGQSQCELILARLAETPGQWVGMPELYRVSGSMAVHSRINDLRRRGNLIEHRNEWKDRQCHSFYRLIRN